MSNDDEVVQSMMADLHAAYGVEEPRYQLLVADRHLADKLPARRQYEALVWMSFLFTSQQGRPTADWYDMVKYMTDQFPQARFVLSPCVVGGFMWNVYLDPDAVEWREDEP